MPWIKFRPRHISFWLSQETIVATMRTGYHHTDIITELIKKRFPWLSFTATVSLHERNYKQNIFLSVVFSYYNNFQVNHIAPTRIQNYHHKHYNKILFSTIISTNYPTQRNTITSIILPPLGVSQGTKTRSVAQQR